MEIVIFMGLGYDLGMRMFESTLGDPVIQYAGLEVP